ncbi:MAG TPA: DUF222 domain-containing protein, partial [Acidimicrobiia bacterium]
MLGTTLDGLRDMVDALVGLEDLSGLTDAGLADTFIDVCREIDRLESVAARLLVGVEGRGIPYSQGATSVAAWAQWHTGQRWAEAKASFDAGIACEQLTLTAKAWAQGEISASLARTICRGMRKGYEDVYREIEEALVFFAAERNVCDLDGIIRHYTKCCDEADDREPADRNGLHISPVGGRWHVNGDFDAKDGKTIDTAVSAALDTPRDGDERSSAKLRADAWVRIARFFMDHGELGLEGGERPHVTLTISWDEIMSWLPIRALPNDPSDLAAFLTRADKAQILCDCNVARIVLGPDSQPLDVGREHRTAPLYLRRAIAQRDRHCRFPGCDRKANRCEAHHVIPWWQDGPTNINNMILLCPFHHHVVHRQGWTNTFDG